MPLGVVLFSSIHFAIRAEKIAKEKGFAVKLIPVPRQLSSDCGVCLRFSWDQKKEIGEVFNRAGVRVESIHRLE